MEKGDMKYKGIQYTLCAIILLTIFGLCARKQFPDSTLAGIQDLEDLNNLKFSFMSVQNDEDAAYERREQQSAVEQNLAYVYAFTAEPTGAYQTSGTDGLQEVTVLQVLRGDTAIEGQKVWIDEAVPGFEWSDRKVYIDGVTSFMQPGETYLIACNPYGKTTLQEVPECSAYYETDCYYGYLNLTRSQGSQKLFQENQTYTMQDLRNTEFIASSEEVLAARQETKEKILQKYLSEIQEITR